MFNHSSHINSQVVHTYHPSKGDGGGRESCSSLARFSERPCLQKLRWRHLMSACDFQVHVHTSTYARRHNSQEEGSVCTEHAQTIVHPCYSIRCFCHCVLRDDLTKEVVCRFYANTVPFHLQLTQLQIWVSTGVSEHSPQMLRGDILLGIMIRLCLRSYM